MAIEIPKVYSDMAEAFDARYIKPANLDVMSYFMETTTRLFDTSIALGETIRFLCEAARGPGQPGVKVVGSHSENTAGESVQESAIHIYVKLTEKHGYEGTLILALLERIASLPRQSTFGDVKNWLKSRRRSDPLSWELVRHIGRPSVPKNVLPVFAAYEAEKRLGKPLGILSEAQMQAIGL